MGDAKSEPAPQRPAFRKSPLGSVGLLLIILGVALPIPIGNAAQGMAMGALRGLLFISTDVLRAAVLVGLGLVILGALRDRRARKALVAGGPTSKR